MKCRYWDCGWCYAPIDVVTSASSCGSCIYPEHCPYLKTEMTDKQPEVISSGTAIISDENGVPTKVHLSDKEKLTEMTETHDLRNQWYDEPVQYETSEKVIEYIEAQIKMLQSKLEFYKELEKTKSPVEEAHKKVFGCYPQTDVGDGYWEYFQNGYKQAQKDYKVGEYQETSQELKTLYQMLDGKYCPDACVFICDIVKEWMYQYDCDYVTCSSEYLEGYEECQTVLEERLK